MIEANSDKVAMFRRNRTIAGLKSTQTFIDLNKTNMIERKLHHDKDGDFAVYACFSNKHPHLELPKFSRELTQWQSFWNLCYAMVDDSSLPDISKLTYPQSLLEGETKDCHL